MSIKTTSMTSAVDIIKTVTVKMQVDRIYELNKLKISDPDRNRTGLDECIINIIKKEGYLKYDFQKTKLQLDGENYLGVLYEVEITGETNEGPKKTSVFIKTIAPNHIDMGFISLKEVYDREKFVYLKLSKIFKELQDEAKVSMDDRYKMVRVFDEPHSEALFLENIKGRGFKTLNRMDVVPLEFAEKSIIELAKWHGLSYVLKEKHRTYFNNLIKISKTPINFQTSSWEDLISKLLADVMKHLNNDVKKYVCDELKILMKKYPKYILTTDVYSVLCHGDYRSNNIMVKETDGRVTEVTPVDYQLVFYGCPILDFLYFVYSATDYDFRKKHLNNLKDLYYESMKTFLSYFEIPIEISFPRKVFERQFTEKRDYGLMVNIFLLPFLFVSENKAPDLSKNKLVDWNMELDDKFKDRFSGCIQEFTDLGYL